jgi:hypothetical protein
VDVPGGVVYLRRSGSTWRIAAATRGTLTVEYPDDRPGRPETVRLRAPNADLTVRLSQIEVNATLDRKVFEVEVPRDATPISLDELRRAGPLGAS